LRKRGFSGWRDFRRGHFDKGLRMTADQNARIRAALRYIDAACSREEWARVGMSIKAGLPGEDGFALFSEWSQSAPDHYSAADTRSTWRSIRADGGVTIATLYRMAQQNGWRDDGPKPPRQTAAAQRRAQEKAHAERELRALAHRRAAERATHQWATLPAASPSHPYLQKKRIAPGFARQDGDRLALCVQDFDGAIHGLQFIAPDGAKRFTPSMAKAGHFIHVEGDLAAPKLIAIAEGWATAMAVAQHFFPGAAVLAALDCGNLLAVAQAARQRFPGAELVLCADDDRCTPQNPGLSKARAAARAVGGTLARPAWPAGAPLELTDFADLALFLEAEGCHV
jgi:putative DNA primase/helicase